MSYSVMVVLYDVSRYMQRTHILYYYKCECVENSTSQNKHERQRYAHKPNVYYISDDDLICMQHFV